MRSQDALEFRDITADYQLRAEATQLIFSQLPGLNSVPGGVEDYFTLHDHDKVFAVLGEGSGLLACAGVIQKLTAHQGALEDCLNLDVLAVKRGHERKGYGSILLNNSIENYSRTAGIGIIDVYTSESARTFYIAQGFKSSRRLNHLFKILK